jgi:H/ACA ribonucleoprotein complex subunit 2
MSDNEESPQLPEALFVSAIANPLIGGKLLSRALKLVKKSAQAKKLRRGVPEVAKAIRKGLKGVVLLAGDVHPVDVYSHLPVLCEEKGIPYAFVSSRLALGAACQTKRAASAVMALADPALAKYADQVDKGIRAVHPYL